MNNWKVDASIEYYFRDGAHTSPHKSSVDVKDSHIEELFRRYRGNLIRGVA